MTPYDAESTVDRYGRSGIYSAGPGKVPDGVKEVKEGALSEKRCKVYGRRQEGKGPRSLCEIHEKTTAESSCEIPGCKLKARTFVNVTNRGGTQ